MSSEICVDFKTVDCQEFCVRIADGTHDSPKEATEGKRLVTSKNVKGGRLEIESAYLISQQDFDAINKRSKVDQWDLLLTMIGTVGEVCVVSQPNPDFAIKNVGLLKCGDELKAKWLYYFLRSPQGQELIDQRKKGSTQQYISLTEIRKLPVSLPETADAMRDIVDILTSLDDRITLLRETNTTLEAIAQALFKSWFVDFGPVHAKMEGRAPEGMDEATTALFPDEFDESELGLVPRGWRVATLAELFDLNPTRKLSKGSMASYLDMASLGTSGHCVEPPIQREMGSGAKFRNGDTLLARITPCLENGKSAFVDFLADGQIGWGSTEFLVLRPKAPLPEYLGYLLCRHSTFREYAIQSMSGTSGRQRIQNDVLGRYLLVMPSREIALVFRDVIEPIQKSIAANHETAQTLATLRDTLLPRLISGQLRLAEAEALFEDACV